MKRFSFILALTFFVSVAVNGQDQDFLDLNAPVTVTPADKINTKHLEYAPVYYGNGLVFVHAREQEQLMDIRLGMPFFELMYAEFGPDGTPGKATSFSANIRTRFHEGPCTFTKDLQQVFFTRTNSSNGQNVVGTDKKTNLKIYLADKGPEDWLNPRELPFCSDDFSVQCPSLSPDQQQLIFMSDKPGGLGGWDLYISNRYAGTWSEPVNLGPFINTAKHERLPFWHNKDVLFFSSEGHDGLGGLDIYASLRLEDGTFGKPVNLGKRFNTRQDDLSFICDDECKSGFFASSRKEGLGKDDIYSFATPTSIFTQEFLDARATIEMIVVARDESTLQAMPGVSVWVFPIGPTGPEGVDEIFEKMIITNPDGSETMQLTQKDVSLAPQYITDLKGLIPVDFVPGKDHLVVLKANGYLQREAVIASGDIIRDAQHPLGLIPVKQESLVLRPDKDCFATGGQVLSSGRKEPLSGVLVQVRSTCTGTIQVIESNDAGHFSTCLVPGCAYEVRLMKTGFHDHLYSYVPGADSAQRIIYLSELDLQERTGGTPVAGDVLVLEHIYYDFDKSAIRTGDARELEALATMMQKYPAMTIELQSHTDARGTAEYNLELSELRGISVRDFLVERGIIAERVVLKPMGESQLRNGCRDGVTCTNAEHQQNRRTEIKILSVEPALEVKYPDR